MTSAVPTPRSRGSLCGLILFLLGAWGGLAPFVGPYFGYGFTPDRTWDYTQGRFYLSALPGFVVVIAGLMILMTRSRGFGGFCAFIAALGGAWFIAGSAVLRLLPASLGLASINLGTPIGNTQARGILDDLGWYAGIGTLMVFFAALALGRFSIAAHKDHAGLTTDLTDVTGAAGLAGAGGLAFGSSQPGQSQGVQSYAPTQTRYGPDQSDYPPERHPSGQYPPGNDTFPQEQYPTGQYPPGHDPFPQEQYPATQEQYPPTQGMYPAHEDPFPPAQQ